jgi:hypothetical protein
MPDPQPESQPQPQLLPAAGLAPPVDEAKARLEEELANVNGTTVLSQRRSSMNATDANGRMQLIINRAHGSGPGEVLRDQGQVRWER